MSPNLFQEFSKTLRSPFVYRKNWQLVQACFPAEIRFLFVKSPLLSQMKIGNCQMKIGNLIAANSQKDSVFSLGEEKVQIYGRIKMENYQDSTEESKGKAEEKVENVIYNCLLSRNFDGYVREKAVLKLLENDLYFTTPFILLLVSEYVLEILEQILSKGRDLKFLQMAQFLNQNPEFYDLLEARIVSYWQVYYRRFYSFETKNFPYGDFRDFQNYPGYQILEKIRQEAKKAGISLPKSTYRKIKKGRS